MTYRYAFPYVPNSLFATVGGTIQPVTEVDPDDPAGGTFDLADDPLDMTVRAYARVSPDVVPAPAGDADDPVIDDLDDQAEEDADIVDAGDDEAEDDDPDAPAPPDDPE